MDTKTIQALKPNVTQGEALGVFSSSQPSTLYWRTLRGPLQRIAAAYVPYVLYRAGYRLHGAPRNVLFAMDAVDGSLDLFTFPSAPESSRLIHVETRNGLSCALEPSRAEILLRDKILRAIFQQGFFKLREFELHLAPVSAPFHIPYWLGFYGRERLRCRVMDAIRRRIEGAKATAFFEHWLAA
jgi:hypothetical protein